MRMRQSLAQLEESFEQEAARDRAARRELRRSTATRTRQRRKAKVEQVQKARFIMLLLLIVLTAVGVTIAMFETLAWIVG
jgi:Flp pilus assembly protein TadB